MLLTGVAGMALLNVAPFLTLEQMIFMDWYGKPTLPPEAVKPFQLAFLLFCWLSVLSAVNLWFVVVYGIQKREAWGYTCYLALGVGWPLGAIGIAIYTTAYWYLLSAGIMTLCFTPPVFLLKRFMKPAEAAA